MRHPARGRFVLGVWAGVGFLDGGDILFYLVAACLHVGCLECVTRLGREACVCFVFEGASGLHHFLDFYLLVKT